MESQAEMTMRDFPESRGVHETPAAGAEYSMESFIPTSGAAFPKGILSPEDNSILGSAAVSRESFEVIKAKQIT